jgi:U3 small nucleolar RNA-associated protein 10
MTSKVTSLSQQLKKLQVPQTQWLLNTEKQRRVSFLYDPKDAANLDSEAVYCLAINGLEQLKLIDAGLFETFENTLFSTTTITFERSVQTKEENSKLNEEIQRFLLNISPYFLLKATHKTIEWLVYKFKIHLYNIDELMMCILPYHETNYFVRAVQMLDIEQSQLWSWLNNNKTSGVVLSSSTLAAHIVHDSSFFNFLIGYATKCLDVYFTDPSYVNGIMFYLNKIESLLI